MAIPWTDYVNWKLDCEKGTPGGDTYVVNGEPMCFRFTKSHKQAVWLLTGELSADVEDIDDAAVDRMLEEGKILINDDECIPGHGWMGCLVWDANKEYVGTVGDRCHFKAGRETEHPTYGRCKYHFGTTKYASSGEMSTGRHSKAFKRLVHEKIEAYAADPNRMDLSRELGIQRALLELLLNKLDEDSDDEEVLRLISGISGMANQVARMADKISTIDHRTALTVNQVMYIQVTVIDVMRRHLPQDELQTAAMELSDRLGTKQAFGSAMTSMLGSGEPIIDMPTTRRVTTRTIEDG